MSDTHKEALAEGRNHARIVGRYLDALEANKPKRGRKRTPDSVKKRLGRGRDRAEGRGRSHPPEPAAGAPRPRSRARDHAGRHARLSGSKGIREGREGVLGQEAISYGAWREFGVPPEVLKKAGITRRDRRHVSPTPSGATPTSRSRRDPRLRSRAAASIEVGARRPTSPRCARTSRRRAPRGTGCSTTRSSMRAAARRIGVERGPGPQRRAARRDDRGDGLPRSARTADRRCGSAPAPRTRPARPARSAAAQRASAAAGSGRWPSSSRAYTRCAGSAQRRGHVGDREARVRARGRAPRRSSPPTRRYRS